MEGYRTFLLRWDSAELTNLTTIRNAFTQAFFSIGTGIGCILAYAAYLDRKAHLPREAVAVVGMDTAVGVLAGMVTFPVVMSFGLKEDPPLERSSLPCRRDCPPWVPQVNLWLFCSSGWH